MSPDQHPAPDTAATLADPPGLADLGGLTFPADDPTDEPPPSRAAVLRLHISGAGPWSVLKASSLVLLGLGLCVASTMAVVWILLPAMDVDPWPSLGWGLLMGVAVVVAEVSLGAALAALVALLHNLTSQYAGGLRLTLTDDRATASASRPALLPDPGRLFRRLQGRLGFPPAGSGALYVEFVDRCGRAWRRLRARTAGRLTGLLARSHSWRDLATRRTRRD
ncbi:hypothetical protein ACH4UM_12185 [Streptomyces sp. NPDC020801]|uniref:hypothetical protein n=1 Tax=unclassified Streptomyces TaxID=2593676 RepID=UPI0037AC13E2